MNYLKYKAFIYMSENYNLTFISPQNLNPITDITVAVSEMPLTDEYTKTMVCAIASETQINVMAEALGINPIETELNYELIIGLLDVIATESSPADAILVLQDVISAVVEVISIAGVKSTFELNSEIQCAIQMVRERHFKIDFDVDVDIKPNVFLLGIKSTEINAKYNIEVESKIFALQSSPLKSTIKSDVDINTNIELLKSTPLTMGFASNFNISTNIVLGILAAIEDYADYTLEDLADKTIEELIWIIK